MGLERITNTLKNCASLGEERANLALEQKGFDGIISRKINRKISAPIAKLLYDADQNINPDYIKKSLELHENSMKILEGD